MTKMNKLVDKFFNRLGYYSASVPKGVSLSEKEVLELFSVYAANEKFVLFLKELCARDINLYFQAGSDRDRDMVRGAHNRTNYFISLIKKANDRKRQ